RAAARFSPIQPARTAARRPDNKLEAPGEPDEPGEAGEAGEAGPAAARSASSCIHPPPPSSLTRHRTCVLVYESRFAPARVTSEDLGAGAPEQRGPTSA